MRVISGKFKGRRLFGPEGLAARPTTDQIKETVFNILSNLGALEGQVLDLFCGSGALGIEALSRGADFCVFADLSPMNVALTKKNLNHVRASDLTFGVFCADYQLALKKLKTRKFDLVFLDPPYNKGLQQKALDKLVDFDMLNQNGVIVCEHSSKNDLQIFNQEYIIDKRTFGSTSVSFIQKKE